MRLLFLFFLFGCATCFAQSNKDFVLVVHGGAGYIGQLAPEAERQYRQGLENALYAGYAILEKGGSALDAVQAAIQILEDDSLFNAGRGSVFSYEGKNEMDASIMDGRNLKAGAVAGITNIRHPICAARAVMEQSPHVMLAGSGAAIFTAAHGCDTISPAWFHTQKSWEAGLKARQKIDSLEKIKAQKTGSIPFHIPVEKYGTVGAVALDQQGNLAAGTSTGGMSGKRWNRIGDSPIIGAGTYASNKSCAVSCTGWGEMFIRLVMAKSVCDRMELAGQSLETATQEMIYQQLPALGGDGGLIAVDKDGQISMPFNTGSMLRGSIRKGEKAKTFIGKE